MAEALQLPREDSEPGATGSSAQTDKLAMVPDGQGIAVPGEAPESDDEDTASVSSVNSITSPSVEQPASVASSRTARRHGQKHVTLLNRKLRESNASLRRSMLELVRQPFVEGVHELNAVGHHIVRTNLQMQETLQVLRTLTGDLLRLQASLDDYQDNTMLPEIRIPGSENSGS